MGVQKAAFGAVYGLFSVRAAGWSKITCSATGRIRLDAARHDAKPPGFANFLRRRLLAAEGRPRCDAGRRRGHRYCARAPRTRPAPTAALDRRGSCRSRRSLALLPVPEPVRPDVAVGPAGWAVGKTWSWGAGGRDPRHDGAAGAGGDLDKSTTWSPVDLPAPDDEFGGSEARRVRRCRGPARPARRWAPPCPRVLDLFTTHPAAAAIPDQRRWTRPAAAV